MFRPTQTVPSRVTALCIVLGFTLAVLYVVVAMISTVDVGLSEDVRSRVSENSGLLTLCTIFTLMATIRPLAGGLLLLSFGALIVGRLPLAGSSVLVFSGLCLLRAYRSRRHLAQQSAG